MSTMATSLIKNVAVVGGSGTIGASVVSALLDSKIFDITIISRHESTATFPPAVGVRKVDLALQEDLVKAFQGQDAVICALNDEAASAQVQLIEAAVQAGVKRFIPSEWANIEMPVVVPELEDGMTGRFAIIDLLKQKATAAKASGTVFHWTAVNCGMLFDWGINSGFLDILLSPTKSAKIWDKGTNIFSATNLTTVGLAVVAVLSTAEAETRDRFVNIESFPASQSLIVAALEKSAGKKWAVTATTTDDELKAAQKSLGEDDFLSAYYRWIRAGIFAGHKHCRLDPENLDNDLLNLPKEDLQDTVDKIVKEE